MCSSIHDEIDALALDIERSIARNEEILDEYEEPEPVSEITPSHPMTDADPADFVQLRASVANTHINLWPFLLQFDRIESAVLEEGMTYLSTVPLLHTRQLSHGARLPYYGGVDVS